MARDNSGSLKKSKFKRTDRDANLSGSIMVEGKEYWLNGWTKIGDDGEKWISLSVRPKEPKAQSTPSQNNGLADDADIPF